MPLGGFSDTGVVTEIAVGGSVGGSATSVPLDPLSLDALSLDALSVLAALVSVESLELPQATNRLPATMAAARIDNVLRYKVSSLDELKSLIIGRSAPCCQGTDAGARE